MTLSFQGFAKTSLGELQIVAVAFDAALPAGTVMFGGLARSPEGYLYVVLS